MSYPRSPKALLGGIAHLGRFIDKIRLRNAGKIQEYNYITVGFDKFLIEFLQIDPKTFEQRVLAGGTDEELLGWACANHELSVLALQGPCHLTGDNCVWTSQS